MNVYFGDNTVVINVDESCAVMWAQQDADRLIAWSKATKLSIDKRKQDNDAILRVTLS